MITFIGKFFSGVFLAVSSLIWPVAVHTPTTTIAPQVEVASSSTTVVDTTTVTAFTPQQTPKAKTVEPTQATSVTQATVIQTPIAPIAPASVAAPTPTQVAPVQSTPATTRYYENGSYVELTDAQHEALLQQAQTAIQQLQGEEQSYITDAQSAQAKISAACASLMTATPIAEGNAAVTEQASAEECSSTSEAYQTEIQIDNATVDSYNAKIQAIKSNYN